jgi:hypothetical protein
MLLPAGQRRALKGHALDEARLPVQVTVTPTERIAHGI